MRIAPIVSVLILTLGSTSAFARRSRCRQVSCECASVACSSAGPSAKPVDAKQTTRESAPQPEVIAPVEKAVPAAATTPTIEGSISEARTRGQSIKKVDWNTDALLALREQISKRDAYLADWERASSKVRRLDCEFMKFMYLSDFEVEKRGRGTIAVD